MNTSDPRNIELTADEKEAWKKTRITGLRKLGSCSFLTAIVSFVSICVGIGCIAAFAKEGRIPYAIGAALISGCLTLLAATFGYLAYREGMAQEKATSDFNIDAGFSVKCKVICNYVFNVLNLTFLVFSATAGIFGLVMCQNDDDYCLKDHDAKIALSALTVTVAAILWIFALASTIWFCFYARSFGFQGRRENDWYTHVVIGRMQKQLDQQQEQIRRQQEQLNQKQRGFYNSAF